MISTMRHPASFSSVSWTCHYDDVRFSGITGPIFCLQQLYVIPGYICTNFSQPCDSYNLARPAFHETMPVAAARWLSSSARHSHARPSLRDHDPLPTAHTLIISISLPAGSLQRAATNEKNFGDEENSLTSKNSRILAHTHHHCYKHI